MIEAASAFWLGLLTSMSPCPLASNIAALSFCLRRGPSGRGAAAHGTAYALGRSAAYAGLAVLVATAGLSIPSVSESLQRYANQALGPILVLTGAVLMGLLPWDVGAWRPSEGRVERLLRGGIPGSAGLGFLLALAFCPVSAALFFGALIPLSFKSGSPFLLPVIYGFATGLPVLLCACAIAGGAAALRDRYERLAALERWARPATGAVLALLGIRTTFKYIFHM